MKNKDFRMHKTMKQLDKMKFRGVREVIWSLNPRQLELVSRKYGVEPYLFAIKTKPFVRIHEVKESLIKDIHYSFKGRKKEIVRHLKPEQVEMLESWGIKVRTVKYRITLR